VVSLDSMVGVTSKPLHVGEKIDLINTIFYSILFAIKS
jgi:hypothetical protein